MEEDKARDNEAGIKIDSKGAGERETGIEARRHGRKEDWERGRN